MKKIVLQIKKNGIYQLHFCFDWIWSTTCVDLDEKQELYLHEYFGLISVQNILAACWWAPCLICVICWTYRPFPFSWHSICSGSQSINCSWRLQERMVMPASPAASFPRHRQASKLKAVLGLALPPSPWRQHHWEYWGWRTELCCCWQVTSDSQAKVWEPAMCKRVGGGGEGQWACKEGEIWLKGSRRWGEVLLKRKNKQIGEGWWGVQDESTGSWTAVQVAGLPDSFWG